MDGHEGKRGVWMKRLCVALFTEFLAAYTDTGICGAPHLVRNIDATPAPESSNPQYLGALGGNVLFGASDAAGAGLWSTNGTASGTVLVYRVNVIAQTMFPGSPNYVVLGTRGYFVGNDGVNGPQLWSTDGTATGTAMVANLGPSGTTGSSVLFGVFGSLLIFSKVDPSGTLQLYATDGTSSGTHALTGLKGPDSYVGSEFLVAGGKFYFATYGVVIGNPAGQIWVSDGTAAGTQTVSNPYGSNTSTGYDALYHPHAFTLVGSSFLYLSNGSLWSVDTTSNSISDVAASAGQPGFGPPQIVNEAAGLIGFGSYALFIANGTSSNSQELWRSDGTSAGTYRVAVINPGPVSFNAQSYPLFQKVGNRVLFIGSDAQYGYQLWSSDGTTANTARLTNASEPSNSPFQIAIYHATIAGTAYLSLSDGAQTTTWSVWRTDGTPAGTQRTGGLPAIDQSDPGLTRLTGDATTIYVEVFNTSGTTSLFEYQPAANRTTLLQSGLSTSITDAFLYDAGALYFSTNDPALGDEPWISDGTPAGTKQLADINSQTNDNGSNPDEFVAYNGALAFVAEDGVNGRELWQSDGTTSGTVLLADINPGPASSNPSHLFVANGVLYFFATDASGTQKFMRLSGTPAVVQILATLSPPLLPFGAYPQFPVCTADTPAVLNGKIHFAANDGVAGVELWRTDGTAAGTQLVSDINPGAGDSNPCQLTVFNGRLYFSATSPDGNELWTSDGTSAGTQQVIDIAPSPAGSSPVGMTVFNGALYFGASNGTDGGQLWKSNGLASSTATVGSIVQDANSFAAPVGMTNGKLLISALVTSAQLTNFQDQLWVSDGTNSGTVNLGALITGAGFLSNGSLAYFSSPGTVGPEPWVSDGTTAGTHLLRDINPTVQSSLLWFANFNGVTLFAVSDPSAGEQLWRSDGTTAGTTLISNIPSDTPSATALASNRHQLTVGQTFFFVGNDLTTGTELYALSNDPPVASPYSASSTNDQSVTINVLQNDSDPDGAVDSSSFQVQMNPSHGTVAVGSNGTLTYTPTAGFSGTDSFTYTIKDNQGAISNAAPITISVTAPPGSHGGGGALDVVTLFELLSLWAARFFGGRRAYRSRSLVS